MCQNANCVLSLVVISSVVQSLIWLAASITGALTYMCVIPVDPYEGPQDFFRVTFVKLYFEGPQCKLNGDYLGQFNEDYKNPNKIDLLRSDLVFGVMIAYAILSVCCGILAIFLCCNRKASKAKLTTTIYLWSGVTLILCLLDILLTFRLVLDMMHMWDYMSERGEAVSVYSAFNTMTGILLVPLIFSLFSTRFIVFWVWNFIMALSFFVNALCCRRTPVMCKPKVEENKVEEPEVESHSAINKAYEENEDFKKHDWDYIRESMEAVTRFNQPPEKAGTLLKGEGARSVYAPTEVTYNVSKYKFDDNFPSASEDHVSTVQERILDFDHNLKNFEQGQGKIKITKPPIGKPVSIPNPPPLPKIGSCNC